MPNWYNWVCYGRICWTAPEFCVTYVAKWSEGGERQQHHQESDPQKPVLSHKGPKTDFQTQFHFEEQLQKISQSRTWLPKPETVNTNHKDQETAWANQDIKKETTKTQFRKTGETPTYGGGDY